MRFRWWGNLLASDAGALHAAALAGQKVLLEPAFLVGSDLYQPAEIKTRGDTHDAAFVVRSVDRIERFVGLGTPLSVTRDEFSSDDLLRLAASSKDAGYSRRLQSISLVIKGWSRAKAAAFADVDRQTLRDWVERYNDGGPDALKTLTPRQAEEFGELVKPNFRTLLLNIVSDHGLLAISSFRHHSVGSVSRRPRRVEAPERSVAE